MLNLTNITTLVQLNAIFSASFNFSDEWRSYVVDFNKTYKNTFEEYAKSIVFEENLKMVKLNNEEYEAENVTYKLKINRFSDMFEDEIMYRADGIKLLTEQEKTSLTKIFEDREEEITIYYEPNEDDELPDAIDWRELGAVTPIENQAMCGSCWAYGVVGAIEGQWYRKTKNLIKLSVQHLIDCANKTHYVLKGCSGGFVPIAFLYLKDHGGIPSAADYKYTALDGECRAESHAATISGFKNIHENEASLKSAIANIGPITAAFHASGPFYQYSEGIYYVPDCKSEDLTHVILIVGYGSDGPDKDFYWIKNSWGTDWGIEGYMKLARNRNNTCGMTTYAFFPDVTDDNELV